MRARFDLVDGVLGYAKGALPLVPSSTLGFLLSQE